ncbi:MAG: penicillin-binding protein 1C [Pseudomonadota bacterium]
MDGEVDSRWRSNKSGPPRRLFAAAGVLLAALSLALAGLTALRTMDDPLAKGRPAFRPSIRLEDRQGRLLWEFLSSRETRSEWLALEDMSPYLIQAALAAEDRRFYAHPGVDPLAGLRAVFQFVREGRVVSGASTITMQLVRLLSDTSGAQTLQGKAWQALQALRLELSHSKSEILEEYLNRVPCGNLVYGVPAASRFYLGKPPDNLSPAEAAFLLSLPQAPTAFNPYHGQTAVLTRRNHILNHMARLGFLTPDQAARAKIEPLDLNRLQQRLQAPHFVMHLRGLFPENPPARIKTTLDLELQSKIENLVKQELARIKHKGIGQAAVLVLDHRTMEVLAWVGSADFFNPVEGQNDGVVAQSQPGSAIKPFTYAAAFDAGLTPADIIEDSPVDYGLRQGVYSPTNYDDRYHGPVSLRTALASSLNVPAVKVLDRVGLPLVHRKMKEAGLTSLEKEPDYYGLGLTLGAGEVSLLELATAYATLATGGVFRPPVFFIGESGRTKTAEPGRRVYSPQAAYLVTHILSDDASRTLGFGRDSLLSLPFPAAAKTGTSKNFRDNWTVGYTSAVVVAVWAGNFDARPMGHVSGISGAGPLWRSVMRLAAERYPPGHFIPPQGLIEAPVCPETGLKATPACPNRQVELFMLEHLPQSFCLLHHQDDPKVRPRVRQVKGLAILNPRPGERFLYDPGIEPGFQNLGLKAQGESGLDWLVWYVNGREVGRLKADRHPFPELFHPMQRGLMTIQLVGLSQGRVTATDKVTIVVH